MEVFWFWLLVLLLLIALFGLPVYPYSRGWGYYPAGIAALFSLILLGLIWLGTIAIWWPWVVVEGA